MIVDISNSLRKEDFLKVLSEKKGNVFQACGKFGIVRSTYYKWLKEDESFKESVDIINEESIDFVESKLFEKIEGVQVFKGTTDEGEPIIYNVPPSDTAIIYFLKCRARARGYNEKVEVDHTTKGEKLPLNAPSPIIIKVNGIVKDLGD